MKTVNRIFVLSLLLLFSCKSYDIDTTWKKIKEMQVKEYAKNPYKYGEKVKLYNDSAHVDFYKYREQVVNNFIKEKGLKYFILQESFVRHSMMNVDDYGAYIYTPDSAYIFIYSSVPQNRKIKTESLKYSNSNECLYLTFKKDSLIMNRASKPTYPEIGNACAGNIFPSYLSVYKKGKLDFLMKSDSVLYRDKKSKVVIDLETLVYFFGMGSSEKVCIENKQSKIMKCDNGDILKCTKDSLSPFEKCNKIN